jgi:plastocyanin
MYYRSGKATTLTLIANNTLFDKSELTARRGTVTIQMDNQDEGIPHNIHVYKGKDNTGPDLGKTDIEAGRVKQTLTLELTAGEYFFVREVHAATMAGKLEVE